MHRRDHHQALRFALMLILRIILAISWIIIAIVVGMEAFDAENARLRNGNRTTTSTSLP